MKAVKAVIQNGEILPDEPLAMTGRHDAIVVVLDADPWEDILRDPRPRPELLKARQVAQSDYLAGKTTPIDPDAMP
ncbi:MAG: hypothetical protein ABFC96_17665 [Thermoguttaceae bacterium]